ncbi:hypothetical protein JCM11491_001574 [Sporobolomyces phaffii]
MFFAASEWKAARIAKDEERAVEIQHAERLLEKYSDRLNPRLETEILSATASEIVQSIKSKKEGWNATSVMLTFIKSAIASNETANNLTEILFSPALKRAMDLDKEFERTGEIVGPLHGVPVSFKDQIDIKDFDSTMGFTHQKNSPAHTDATLVSIVRAAGGIPFAKTNVPQTMLSFECSNPLFGVSRNPYDPTRTPGGSSGGEAALLGSDGSALGFGSDVGGSLRIPCHFSGCFALKPTTQRFPSKGCRGTNHGFEAIKASMGPMGRSVDDVELLTRVVFETVKAQELGKFEEVRSAGYDPVKLRDKLRFGYYLTDAFCHASPACSRAVLAAAEAVRKQGHEVVEIPSPNAIDAMEIFVALTSANGYEPLLANLLGDPQESSLFLVTIGPKLPWFLRAILGYVAENWLGDDKMARLLRASKRKSATEMQAWQWKRPTFGADQPSGEVFQDNNLDFVLCATQATPALKVGQTWDLSPLAIGTILYNVVDSAVGLIPVTHVSSELDALTPAFYSKIAPGARTCGSKLVESRVYGTSIDATRDQRVYDAVEMEGLPVGIQLVAGWGEEEKVIEGMKVVDRALGERGFGPGQYAKRAAKKETRVY